MRVFDVTMERTSQRVRLTLRGELDLDTAARLREALPSDLDQVEVVVIDLRDLAFMDSTGLHEMLRLQERIQSAGAKLEVVRGPDNVQRLFKLTDLDQRFTFVDEPQS